MEFTTAEGEAKAYLIRKYLDADIQRDIWDMLVVRDGELKTKIARIGVKGRNYAESQIKGAGNEASRSDSAGGGYRERLHPTRRYQFINKAFVCEMQAQNRTNSGLMHLIYFKSK